MASDKKKNDAETPIYDVPKGRYRLIAWDIDMAGKQLDDEICHVAAYHPDSQFSQYILLQNNLSLFVEWRYKIRVVTVSRYRFLKDLQTNKILKAKREIFALIDFISWLEENKDDSHDGIILAHHDVKNKIASQFLEALKRNDLFDRFAGVVKGFCNTYPVTKLKYTKPLRSYSLQNLSRAILNEEGTDLSRSAAFRAKACYTILQRVRSYSDVVSMHFSEFARQYSHSTAFREQALVNLRETIECQKTLRPIFRELINFDWGSRRKACHLRRKLAESHIDFYLLQNAWHDGGKKAIKQILNTIQTTQKRDYNKLLKILNCYFDPQKKQVDSNFLQRRKTYTNKINGQEEGNHLQQHAEITADGGESSAQSNNLPQRSYYKITFID